MATYKVIQDIEAEDKLVGPLTLRQFIYAGIAAVCLYICFLCYSRGAEFLIGIFFPVAAVAGFFAFPWKGEQPTELWALAKLRFMIKPRVRIWDQEGAKDLVTITVPKSLKKDRPSRPALSQNEVRSRLKALANTIDSRGWATRNAAYGIYNQNWTKPSLVPAAPNPGMAAMIPDDDMFSENNIVTQNLDAMLAKSQQDQRQRVMDRMANAQAPVSRLAALPNIPTPAPSSAYSVAPAPAPLPMPAGGPQMMQMQQMQPMQQMPQMPPAMQQQPADHWFANGPAYPTNPAPQPAMSMPPQQPPMLPPAMTMAPPMPQPNIPAMPTPEAPTFQQATPMNIPDARIESDMPLAVSATPTQVENELGQDIMRQNKDAMAINYGHMRVLQPNGQGDENMPQNGGQPSIDTYQASSSQDHVSDGDHYVNGAVPEQPEPVTSKPNPAILELANNDDLDIATIARQANREMNKTPDEVEIRLH